MSVVARSVGVVEEITRHEVLAGLDQARDALLLSRAGLERSWALTDAESREAVEQAAALVASAQAVFLAAVKNLDTRPDAVPGAAGGNGAKTFLVHRLNLDGGKAKAFLEAAYALDPDTGDLALVGEALADGDISYDHALTCVRAVAKLPKRLRDLTVTDESTGEQVSGMQLVDRVLARVVRDQPLKGVQHLTDQLVTLLDPDREERFDEDAHLRRGLSLTIDSTGMGVLRAVLPPADAAMLKAMLLQLAKPDPATTCTVQNPDGSLEEVTVTDERSHAARMCDALLGLLRAGAARVAAVTADELPDTDDSDTPGPDPRQPGDPPAPHDEPEAQPPCSAPPPPPPPGAGGTPQVRLIITATAEQAAGLRGAGKAYLDRVGPIGPGVLGVLACSATLRRVLTDTRGVPVDVGREQRLATPGLRAALVARDRGCVIPGCTVPADGCDAHHAIPWSKGGTTDLANMALACPRHHQAVHAGIWEIEIRDGIPWVRPPAWVDPERRWRRNPLHHHVSDLHRAAQQLSPALAEQEPSGGRREEGGPGGAVA